MLIPSRVATHRQARRITAVAACLTVALAGGVTFSAAGTPAAAVASQTTLKPTTIWGGHKPAGVRLSPSKSAVELGAVFKPTVAGKVTAIRFYKVKGSKGRHVGTLWTTSGKKLAKVTFKHETASGWQKATLSKPVTVKAGTRYVVSYHVPKNGRFGRTVSAVGSTSSTSLVTTLSGGVYRHSRATAFPRKSAPSTRYWVDVVFSPKAGTAAPTPPVADAPSVAPAPSTPGGASAGGTGFPTLASTGLPSGWKPSKEVTGDYWIRTPGTVVEDLRVTNGTIYVQAKDVTLRRVEGIGVQVNNYIGNTCGSGLVIEDSTFRRGSSTNSNGDPAIGAGGYTARNVLIDGAPEGFRVGGKSVCGGVTIHDSYVNIQPPDVCGDWHGDGIQGYDGGALTLRNTAIEFHETDACGGTAPFFYPAGQGNTTVDIDGLLVSGGGFPFRLGMPGKVTHLNVVDRSWGYGALDVSSCSSLSAWSASIVTLDSAGQPVPVRSLKCG